MTTKTWTGGYADTARSVDASLRALRTDYVDLLLVHEPSGDVADIWRALEEAYRAGKARAIGVSNFLGNDFERLLGTADVMPTVNQLECHVYRQQRDMQTACAERGVLMTSWSPFAAGRNGFFFNPTLSEIAEAHGASVAQVGLRWLVQRGIPVIPKSADSRRMRENLMLGFELSSEEMDAIAALDTGRSQFGWW